METKSIPTLSMDQGSAKLLLSVMIPARREASVLRECLASLVRQSEEDFSLGREWEILVIADAPSQAVRQAATEFSGVTVLEAPPPGTGWAWKANALWFASQQARGKWLLFTEPNVLHEAGDLRRAMHEAERHKTALLSYSPLLVVRGFLQRVLMTLIVADVAQAYPSRLVNQPDSRVAAANGEFLLIQSDVYHRIGGYKAVQGSPIEDMELAQRCKQGREALRLRYAPDAVSAHVVQPLGTMCDGWKMILAFLFPDALSRAFWKLFHAVLLFGLPLLAIWMYLTVARAPVIWAVVLWWAWRLRVHYADAAKAHFPFLDTLLSPLALPLFTWLLLDSWRHRHLGLGANRARPTSMS